GGETLVERSGGLKHPSVSCLPCPRGNNSSRVLHLLLRTLFPALLWFARHIIDLVNQPIQYDRSCSEKPFLPNRHSPLVWPTSFNAAPTYVAVQQIAFSELYGLDSGQVKVVPRQIPHQIITACRYRYSRLKSGTRDAGSDSCR